MDNQEQRIRDTTVVQLWDQEGDDLKRFNSGGMSEVEALECSDFWRKAADLYRERASQMRGMARYIRQQSERHPRRVQLAIPVPLHSPAAVAHTTSSRSGVRIVVAKKRGPFFA